MTSRDEAEHLLRRSKEFLSTAEYQMKQGFLGLAAFSLEQAVQLHLKARLIERGVEYPRTRSVRRLLRMLSEVEDADKRQQVLNLMDSYLLELGMLEDAYITIKVPPKRIQPGGDRSAYAGYEEGVARRQMIF